MVWCCMALAGQDSWHCACTEGIFNFYNHWECRRYLGLKNSSISYCLFCNKSHNYSNYPLKANPTAVGVYVKNICKISTKRPQIIRGVKMNSTSPDIWNTLEQDHYGQFYASWKTWLDQPWKESAFVSQWCQATGHHWPHLTKHRHIFSV